VIELSQVVCFLTIIEESSFSRAANRLGLAQSAISQKLRRLEDQIGFKLIDRTSRQLQLSSKGAEFLPYARQMVEAETNARSAARTLLGRERNTLRLGAYNFLQEERIALMEYYMAQVPGTRLEIENGIKEQMLEMLREGQIDAFLCLAQAGAPLFEFNHVFIRRVSAHLVFPAGHPLAVKEIIRMEDLTGIEMAISPGRQDAPMLQMVCEHLTAKGVVLIPAPEADRRAILSFARLQGIPSLRWLDISNAQVRREEDDTVVLPIAGSPLVLDHYLYTRRGPDRPLVQEFLRTVEDFVRSG